MMSLWDNVGITGRKHAAKKATNRGYSGTINNLNVDAADHMRRLSDDLDYRRSVRRGDAPNPTIAISQRARLFALRGSHGQGSCGRAGDTPHYKQRYL